MRLVGYVPLRLGETSTALERDVPVDSTVPIKPARTRSRQATCDMYRIGRLRIFLSPHRVVGRKLLVDDYSV
jgi:hypothetical protein